MKTGKVIWTKNYESPDQGPNGLVVAGGRVYGATATAAFALDEKTGRQLWSVTLVRNEHEGIDMAPGYHDGIVYVVDCAGEQQQVLRRRGRGHPMGAGRRDRQEAVALRHRAHKPVVSENAVSTPVAGCGTRRRSTTRGICTSATANPAPFPGTEQSPWGSSRPGPEPVHGLDRQARTRARASCSGTTSRRRTTCMTGICRTRRSCAT